jgi:hypothetical protein
MLKSVAGHTVKSLVRKKTNQAHKKFLNWEEIRSIALVVEDAEMVSKHLLDTLLDEFKKHCDVFYLELKAKTPTYADWHCLTKKDKNLIGLPKKKVLDTFKTKKYDLIINAAGQSIFYSAALSSSLQSTCTCSSTEEFGHSDLIIKRAEKQDLITYLREVLRYLKMINSKPSM